MRSPSPWIVTRQAPVLLVGERGAGRRGRAIALAAAGGRTGEVIMPGHVPQPPIPGRAVNAADGAHRPILVADRLPKLGGETARGDRARIPSVKRVFLDRLDHLPVRRGELLAPRRHRGLAIGGN